MIIIWQCDRKKKKKKGTVSIWWFQALIFQTNQTMTKAQMWNERPGIKESKLKVFSFLKSVWRTTTSLITMDCKKIVDLRRNHHQIYINLLWRMFFTLGQTVKSNSFTLAFPVTLSLSVEEAIVNFFFFFRQ